MGKNATSWETASEAGATWQSAAKTGVAFFANPRADDGGYTYDDPAITYDSSHTYDGIDPNELTFSEKRPAIWAETTA